MPPDTVPTVLVVEDELLQRLMAADIVREAGLPVAEATNAHDALALIERCPAIGVVFTDVDLGRGMTGLELAEAVRARWPDKVFIFTSGHLSVRDRALPEAARFLPKPYRPAELRDVLRAFAG